MNTTVKFFFGAMLLFGGGAATISCTDYQDEIDALDYRVKVLEDLVDRVNTDLEAMEAIVGALEDADYITGVKDTDDGYLVNFAKAGPVELKDGIDGKDGIDAEVPDIDVVKGADGNWYWTINGEPLTTDGTKNGEMIRVNGADGVDGRDGRTASEVGAVVPQVRINPASRHWEISVDGGQTWSDTGSSADGKDGIDGQNGEDDIFLKVDEALDGQSITFTLRDGRTFTVPII